VNDAERLLEELRATLALLDGTLGELAAIFVAAAHTREGIPPAAAARAAAMIVTLRASMRSRLSEIAGQSAGAPIAAAPRRVM